MAMRRVYEDFRPTTEWKQQDLFCVYLPGFTDKDIRVTREGLNIIRVGGERLVAGNRWIRFQESFQAPENCDMSGARRNIASGILTVTVPRKTTATQVAPKAAAKTEPPPSTPYVGADARAEQKSQKAKEDIRPPATSSVLDTGKPADTDSSRSQKTEHEHKHHTGKGQTPPKITPTVQADKQTDGKSFEDARAEQKSQKAKEDIRPPATSSVLDTGKPADTDSSRSQRTEHEHKHHTGKGQTPPKITPIGQADKQTDGKSFEDDRAKQTSQKAKEDISPQATSSVLDTGKPADTDSSRSQRTEHEPKRPTGEGQTPPKITPVVQADKQTDGKSFEGTTTDPQKVASKPTDTDSSRSQRTEHEPKRPMGEGQTPPKITPVVQADKQTDGKSFEGKPADTYSSRSQRTEHELKRPTGEGQTPPKTTPVVQVDKQTDGKSFEDARAEQKSQKAKEDIRPQATSSVLDTGKPADTDSSRSQRTEHEPKRPTGEGQTPPKITPIVQADKQTDGKSFEDTTTDPQKVASKPVSQKSKEETPVTATPGTDERKQKDEKAPSESETKEKAFEKTAGRESMRQEKGRDSGAKAKETIKVMLPVGESSKKMVNGIPDGPNKGRQLMVNIGVAVLVIVALGAYVAYTFGSSGKAKQETLLVFTSDNVNLLFSSK
ncbi:LOW QUALITY PROTEIN: hypothetical protein RJ640_006474 [Escallonia rubra]|uniref:SHSP domain-containing protein n=1 Tax=Escallonia rubra TaxID=112253 RepID=A0AA88UPP7_9ASTE|nr:LOW QUALITY PROTEIN: hypothetical protein RJ640_006474 [Escallonia rubra]